MPIQYSSQDLAKRYEANNHTPLFARYAEALREEGNVDEAIAICHQGIKAFPGSITGYLILGKCFRDKGETQEAITQFQTVFSRDNRCLFAIKALGDIYMSQQQTLEAAEKYILLAKLDPLDPDAAHLSNKIKAEHSGQSSATEAAVDPVSDISSLESPSPDVSDVGDFIPDSIGENESQEDVESELLSDADNDDGINEQFDVLTGSDDIETEIESAEEQFGESENMETQIMSSESAEVPSQHADANEVINPEIEEFEDNAFEDNAFEDNAFENNALDNNVSEMDSGFTQDLPEEAHELDVNMDTQILEADGYQADADESALSPANIGDTPAAEDLMESEALLEIDAPDEGLTPESDASEDTLLSESFSVEDDNVPNSDDEVSGDDVGSAIDFLGDSSMTEPVIDGPASEPQDSAQTLVLNEADLGFNDVSDEQALLSFQGVSEGDPIEQVDGSDDTLMVSVEDLQTEGIEGDTLAMPDNEIPFDDSFSSDQVMQEDLSTVTSSDVESAFDNMHGDDVLQGESDSNQITGSNTEDSSETAIILEDSLNSRPAGQDSGIESDTITDDGVAVAETHILTENELSDGMESGLLSGSAESEAGYSEAGQTLAMDEEELRESSNDNDDWQDSPPNMATVTLAEIYFKQGLKEQALEIYRQLLEREPENEEINNRIKEIEAAEMEDSSNKERNNSSDRRRPRSGVKIKKRRR
jgi:pilus assembly protein FimV